MSTALAASVAVPVLSGLALLVVGRRATRIVAPVAVAAAAITVVLAVLVAVGRPVVSMPLLAGIDAGLAETLEEVFALDESHSLELTQGEWEARDLPRRFTEAFLRPLRALL